MIKQTPLSPSLRLGGWEFLLIGGKGEVINGISEVKFIDPHMWITTEIWQSHPTCEANRRSSHQCETTLHDRKSQDYMKGGGPSTATVPKHELDWAWQPVSHEHLRI